MKRIVPSAVRFPLLKAIVIILLLFFYTSTHAQKLDSVISQIDSQKWIIDIKKKTDKLETKIVSTSNKSLAKIQHQEQRVYEKMLKSGDSIQARLALEEIKLQYESLRHSLKTPLTGTYLSKLDTLTTALKFLDQGGDYKKTLESLKSLQTSFNQAEAIKKFIRERKALLKDRFERLGLTKQFRKINKEVYYYNSRINEYKNILKDSKKRERKALELLSKTKPFKDFMRKHSQLATLFRLPSDPNDPSTQANLAGLQTRAQVNSLIEQQLSLGGPSARDQLRQNLQSAQGQLRQLKERVVKSGGSSSDDEIPDFKPNNQKSKSFLKRLEYGTNLQTQKATRFFPTTTDIALSLGYKLNDKSIIGVGASYKMGLGRGWNQMRLTHEGIGFRSFGDLKIKGGFWLSGGFEMNYRTAFTNVDQLRSFNAWQQSGLIGISKSVKVRSKVLRKTKAQLLWDFLSYKQQPLTQPILFRVGYTF